MSADGDETLSAIKAVAKQVEDVPPLATSAEPIQRLIPQELVGAEPFDCGLGHLAEHRFSAC